MSTPDRTDPALQGGDGEVRAAHQDREQRLAADITAMQAGPAEHAAGLTDHHQGLPAVETQMKTHGAAPPAVPDTGGHQSASDPIGLRYLTTALRCCTLGGMTTCTTCSGSGIIPAANCTCTGPHTCTPRVCPACKGSGHQ